MTDKGSKKYRIKIIYRNKKYYMELNLSDIIQVEFPDNQFVKVETEKTQIVLHHTVGSTVQSVIDWWVTTPEKVAVSFIVDRDGKIYQCYSSKFWGSHLSVKADYLKAQGFADYGTRNVTLDKHSIGIEINSWGGLVKDTDGKWYPALWNTTTKKYTPNKKVKPIANVVEYPKGFRGFYGFEKYSDAQVESVRQLLVYLGNKFNIPLDYSDSIWNVSKDALGGKSGVFCHVSYRSDKSDAHPQPEFIEMLKKLK